MRTVKPLRTVMLGLCLVWWTSGCARLVVIAADREITRLRAGEKATRDGYLVPDARMLEILDALGRKQVELENAKP